MSILDYRDADGFECQYKDAAFVSRTKYDALAARLAEAELLLEHAARCCLLHDYQFYTDFPPKVAAFLRPADSAPTVLPCSGCGEAVTVPPDAVQVVCSRCSAPAECQHKWETDTEPVARCQRCGAHSVERVAPVSASVCPVCYGMGVQKMDDGEPRPCVGCGGARSTVRGVR